MSGHLSDPKLVEKSEKDKKAEAKVYDNADEYFCGFLTMMIVDEDGIPKQTKGNGIGGPLHVSRNGGTVELTSEFPLNPLVYTQIENEEKLFLTGECWYGEAKRTPLNGIGKLLPRNCKALLDATQSDAKEGPEGDCEMKLVMPFVKGNSTAKVKLTTKDQRFITKIVQAKVCISEAEWAQWKDYRMRFWRSSKAWGGSGGDDEKEDKDKKDKKDE